MNNSRDCSVIINPSICTRLAGKSSTMSSHASQPSVAEAATSPSPGAAIAARQTNLGEARQVSVAPSSVTQESLRESVDDAVNKLSLSGGYSKRVAAADATFEEAAADIRAVNEPLYRSMLRHHETVKKVRSDEVKWMRTMQTYHWQLERFPAYVTEMGLSEAETDRHMDEHSARLLAYDKHLEAWSAHRTEEEASMSRCHGRAVEENVRRQQENARREELARRGHRGWFPDHESGETTDHEDCVKEQRRWEMEYGFWERTFDDFAQERVRNVAEYEALFARQAQFHRVVGNYQILRFFEEVERLNSTACDGVEEEEEEGLRQVSAVGDCAEVGRGHQVPTRIVGRRDAFSDADSCYDEEIVYTEAPTKRRYTL